MSAQTEKVLLLTGMFFINMLAGTLILSSITFFFNGTISAWQFPAAFIISVAINYFVVRDQQLPQKVLFKSFFIIGVVTIASLLIALYFYDISYDGQAYHQEAIVQLKMGWNPYTTILPGSVNDVMYLNYFSKGAEISQSTIYGFIHHVEAGKATNIMLLIAAFCLTLSFLISLKKISLSKCVLLSLIITLNPVTVNELLTYYVDGQLAALLLCFIISGLMIIKQPDRFNLLLLSSIIIIAVNIKFTAVIYIVVFTMAFLIWVIFTKKTNLSKKLFYTLFIAGILGVVMVGYNPYVTNTVKHQHPFYPVMGKNKIDIIATSLPQGFEGKNAAEKFLLSFFAHTNDGAPAPVNLKIPFTFNKTDIINASKIDTHVAGFGPFFSGIVLLAIVLIVFLYKNGNDLNLLKNGLYLILVISVTVFIIPESWWARFVPQLWLIPVVALVISELSALEKWPKILRSFLYVLFFLNIALTFISVVWAIFQTSMVDYQLAELKASHRVIKVQWGTAASNRIRFQEHHIPYLETDLSKVKSSEVIHSDSKFIAPDTLVNLPKPFLVKIAEKLQKEK